MTQLLPAYETPGNHNFEIPTRREFHRYAVEKLSNEDFCTSFSGMPGYKTNRIASSINWTKKNRIQKRRPG